MTGPLWIIRCGPDVAEATSREGAEMAARTLASDLAIYGARATVAGPLYRDEADRLTANPKETPR
jgi:hypothetical protein